MPRVLVKIGTNVISNRANRILRPVLRNLVGQLGELFERGIAPVVVSSGSIISGMESLGPNIPAANETQRRQVYSATGQPRLMRLYADLFEEYGMKCAQVLPTKDDFAPGAKRDNMVQCLEGLLAAGVVPIVNEDDATSVTRSMFHDNDELAALMAELLRVDRLIILTDAEGVFDGHPAREGTTLIREVSAEADLTRYIEASGKAAGEGRGGMGSKLEFAQRTARLGIPAHIVRGRGEDVIVAVVEGRAVGTSVNAVPERAIPTE